MFEVNNLSHVLPAIYKRVISDQQSGGSFYKKFCDKVNTLSFYDEKPENVDKDLT